jgi:Membrane protein involved in the export of O-antigen and teichoic acid
MKIKIKKSIALPVAVKASIAFFLISLLQKGISFITIPIFTRILNTNEFGKYTVFLSWMQVIGIVAMFCLSAGVLNIGMQDHKDDRDRFIFSLLILSNSITIIIGIIISIFSSYFTRLMDLSYDFILLMFIIFLTQPALTFWTARQRYEYKYKASSILNVIISIISPLSVIIAIVAFSCDHLKSIIYFGQGIQIPIYIAIYIYIAKKAQFKIKISYLKNALLYNFPLIPHYLSGYILSNADRIMISSIINDSATAFYGVAYSIAAIVFVFWSAINASLVPFTFEKCEEKNYKAINKVTLPIMVLFAGICILVILLGPEVLKLITTPAYHSAVYVIPPIVGGVFFQATYFIFANIIFYYKKPKYVMVASVVSAVINILLNYLFIPIYGYVAAGYTTLFSYIIQVIIDYLAMKKIVKVKIYNEKLLTILSIAMVIISLFSNLLYNFTFIRYGVLLILVVLCIIYRDKIIKTIKSMK